MPVLVQAFLQWLYGYWHPYSNNASTDMEHVIIATTSTVIHMMPVLVTFIFANHANTSTGFPLWQYWYWHCLNACTGTGILFPTMPIPARSYIWCPYLYIVFLLIVPIPVRACSLCQNWYWYFLNAYTGTGILFPTMPVLVQSTSDSSTGILILLIPVRSLMWCPVFICTKLN